jgi:hypothetical protein
MKTSKKAADEFYDEGDEVIAEIRAVRHAISEECGHHPNKLVEYYLELERNDPGVYIDAPELEDDGRFAA